MSDARLAAAAFAAALALAQPVAAEAEGAQVFHAVCAACHAEGGIGTPGVAPPLNRPEFWSKLGPKAPGYISGVLAAGLTGKISAAGQDYIGLAMPAQEKLTDAEAAAAASWVLATLGGISEQVTPEQIASARAAPPAHADLRKIRKGE